MCDADDDDGVGSSGSGLGPLVNKAPADVDALRNWLRKLELDSFRATVSTYIDGRLDCCAP